MARPIQQRFDYTTEVTRLNRLRRAAAEDARQDVKWRKEIDKNIQGLIVLLATAKTGGKD